MRIATCNLRGGGSRRHWETLVGSTRADLLFVQESKDPARFPAEPAGAVELGGACWAGVEHGKWGSALFARGGTVEPIELPGFAGWVVGGAVTLGASRFTAFSVHIPFRRGGYVAIANALVDALVHTLVDRLKPLAGDGPLVLGGDWNVTCARRAEGEAKRNTKGELELLDRLERELGVVPAWSSFHAGKPLPQTLRWMKEPATPYHCDGVFLPSAWAPRIGSVDVLAGPTWNELSDRNPVAQPGRRGMGDARAGRHGLKEAAPAGREVRQASPPGIGPSRPATLSTSPCSGRVRATAGYFRRPGERARSRPARPSERRPRGPSPPRPCLRLAS